MKRTKIPDWIGNLPFPPDKKKTVVITRDMEVPTLYGFDGTQVENPMFISTDKISLGLWRLPPGSYCVPPGFHRYGDECYYILKGVLTAFNPETGEVLQLEPGDTLQIPKETRHQVFNFTGEEVCAICVIAPKIWAEDDMGVEIPDVKEPKFFKGSEKG